LKPRSSPEHKQLSLNQLVVQLFLRHFQTLLSEWYPLRQNSKLRDCIFLLVWQCCPRPKNK
jgi:hypothetical protein